MKAVRKIIEHAQESIVIDLPEEYRNRKLEVIILATEEQTGPEHPSPGKYDFSDFAGKLNWQGDALATQRKLRDEWD